MLLMGRVVEVGSLELLVPRKSLMDSLVVEFMKGLGIGYLQSLDNERVLDTFYFWKEISLATIINGAK